MTSAAMKGHGLLEGKVVVVTAAAGTGIGGAAARRCLEEGDRKSTRLNSSHSQISDPVFCLKKKHPLATRPRGPVPHRERRTRQGYTPWRLGVTHPTRDIGEPPTRRRAIGAGDALTLATQAH